MDAELLEHARTVDPAVLGRRVRDARLARRMTQTAVAGGEMSTAYVSRIEAGQRRPDPDLIAVIAERVGVPMDQLVMGASRDVIAEQRLALDWAQLALRTGDAASALAQVDAVLSGKESPTLLGKEGKEDSALAGKESPTLSGKEGKEGKEASLHADVRTEALRIKAGALETTGRLDDAIMLLEDLAARTPPHDHDWLGDGQPEPLLPGPATSAGPSRPRAKRAPERSTRSRSARSARGDHARRSALQRLLRARRHRARRPAVPPGDRPAPRSTHRTTPASAAATGTPASSSRAKAGTASAIELAHKALAYFEVGDDFRRTATGCARSSASCSCAPRPRTWSRRSGT